MPNTPLNKEELRAKSIYITGAISKGKMNADDLSDFILADRDAAVREARAQGYIDGVNSDKSNVASAMNQTTIESLEAIKMYAIDCTFGKGFESIHHEKAIPLKSIDSRIEYYKSLQSQPNSKEDN